MRTLSKILFLCLLASSLAWPHGLDCQQISRSGTSISGYIDKTGALKFRRTLTLASLNSNYSNGYVLFWGDTQFFDLKGAPVFSTKFDEAMSFSERLAGVRIGKTWGFIDLAGDLVIKPRFDDVKPFKEGLAPAMESSRWGFIDPVGKWVIKPQFEHVLPFSEGLAAVCLKGKIGYIDKEGGFVIHNLYPAGTRFSEGLALVVLADHNAVAYINKYGKEVFRLKQKSPTSVLETSYYLTAGNSNQNGRWTSSNLYGADLLFHSHRLLFERNGRFGYLNENGKVTIPVKFTEARPFREGLACVSLSADKSDPHYGYINDTGRFVIQPHFLEARDFHDGLAFIRTRNSCGYIDKSGKIVLQFRNGIGGDYSDGMAAFSNEGLLD